MIYRSFGKTSATVSSLGMGCMRLEHPNQIDEMAQVVYHAFERGINYFDTAPYYCDDKSEIIVGTAVKEMKKSGRSFCIATKTGESREERIGAQLERSLQRLNLEAIDFYHVWFLVHPDDLQQRKKNGLIAALRKFKEEGLVRHICVSTHLHSHDIPRMIDEGEGLFDGITIGLNVLNFPSRLEGARAAANRGMGVVTMNTLGGGLLNAHADHFQFILRKGDKSVVDAALRFNLSLPEVSVALVGFRNQSDVDEAVEAAERCMPLTEDEISQLKHLVIESSEGLCTQCNYCRDCPSGIPIARIMEAYNHRILSHGDPQPTIDQLVYYWKLPNYQASLAACMKCGKCEKICTQHLPILERFDQIADDARHIEEKKLQGDLPQGDEGLRADIYRRMTRDRSSSK